MPAPPGFTQIVAEHIQDAAGNKLASGSLVILPTDGNDVPITATAGYPGGPILTRPARVPIVNGVLSASAWVPDTSLTAPTDITYRFTIQDATGLPVYVLYGVQPSGASFNLDTYSPDVPTQAPKEYGPQGPSGTLSIGSIAGLPFGATPTVSNVGTPINAVLDLGIPQGAPGSTSGALTLFSQAPSGTIDGSNTSFTISVIPLLLLLFLDRLYQYPGVDYTLLGSTISYTKPPQPGDFHYAQGVY